MKKFKHTWIYLIWLVIGLAYSGLSLMAPAQEAISRYSISLEYLNLLRLSVAVPLLLIWGMLFYGAANVSGYAKQISKSNEGQGYTNTSWGLWLLVAVLIAPSFLNFASTYNPDNQQIEMMVVLVGNYFGAVLTLAAMYLLFKGSRKLMGQVKAKAKYMTSGLVGLGLVGVYGWFFVSNAYRVMSDNPDIVPTFYTPDWISLPTVVTPFVVAWFLGLAAADGFYQYAKHVKGVFYKSAFANIAWGVGGVVVASIFTEVLGQMGAFFESASLNNVLVVVYVFLLAIAIGYAFIARGARNLAKMEEIV